MSFKASVHGPNRRKNRPGDTSVASNLTSNKRQHNEEENQDNIIFCVKSLDRLLGGSGCSEEEDGGNDCEDVDHAYSSDLRKVAKSILGDDGSAATVPCCLFTWNEEGTGGGGGGLSLLLKHFQLVKGEEEGKSGNNEIQTLVHQCGLGSDDPILIHFHDIPIFVLRAVPLTTTMKEGKSDGTAQQRHHDFLYLSNVQCHNHKVCEDTVMEVTCCSRLPHRTKKNGDVSTTTENYKLLSAIGVEVHPRGGDDDDDESDDEGTQQQQQQQQNSMKKWTFNATDISRKIINQTYHSVLTVNESLVISLPDDTKENGYQELVCRINEVRTQKEESDNNNNGLTSAEATMDDPYRGRVDLTTELYIFPSDPKSGTVHIGRHLPRGKLPDDVVHITTSDMEWFPVRRVLLAPCIKLTKYVQAGRGKYKDDIPTLSDEERSEDAPTDDGCPHCKVPIDCCTFDRVLLFITSLLYPEEHTFSLDLTEVNALSAAADALGLQALNDVCQSQTSTFESRVIKDRYIRFAEVKERNDHHGELLIILDGMVLDISRWIDEHPGGASIIPSQALNIDCTVFFEMYHVSRQSFLYLKSFYIGELSPEDAVTLRSSAEGVEASEGFLQSLRSYTDEWRVSIGEKAGEKVHKSF